MGTSARTYLVVALACLVTQGARAQEPAVRTVPIVGAIDVRSSDPCLDVRVLAEQIARWLHRDAIDARINVLLRPAAEGGESIEVIRDGSVVAERAFDGGAASCAEKQAALGLMIALALDATIVETLEAPPLVQVVSAPPPPEPGNVFALELRGLASVGVLPHASGGAALYGELLLSDRLALRLGLLGEATSTASLDRGHVSSALLAAHVEACVGATVTRFRGEGCAGVGAGGVLAEGRGFTENARTFVPWAAVALGAAFRVRLSDVVALRVALDALVPFVRPVLVVTDVTGAVAGAEKLSPVALRLGFGAVFSFR